MLQQNTYRISENFLRVLGKVKGTTATRKDLIEIAIKINKLSAKQATGLIDRHIHSLKKQEVITATGPKNNRSYIFTDSFLLTITYQNDEENFNLLSEKKSLEEEVLLTGYELQAYLDFFEKLPREKKKISKLHEKASNKLCKLKGKLRAVSQLIAYN